MLSNLPMRENLASVELLPSARLLPIPCWRKAIHKTIKINYVSSMKRLKSKNIIAFKNHFIAYGKFRQTNFYKIEIVSSLYFSEITLYKGFSRPSFRNITFLGIVVSPFCIIRSIIETIWYVCWCPFEFFVKTMIKESFVNSIYEKIGGYIVFFLMLYGLYQLIF